MYRFFIKFLVCIQLIFLFSCNVYANTVDDVREFVGKDRIDAEFTQEEVNLIISQYNAIERQNEMYKIYELNGNQTVDVELLQQYENDLKVSMDALDESFRGGACLSDVLKNKSKVESMQKNLDSVRKETAPINVEYIPNVWAEKYEKVQKMLSNVNEYIDIGDLGDALKVPYLSEISISSPYGVRKNVNDEYEIHKGIDFNVSEDITVVAQWNGIVSKVSKNASKNYTVEILHGDALKTVYKNLKEVYVKENDKVTQYQGVGKINSKGYLHFEVILDGEAINPLYLYGEKGIKSLKTYVSLYSNGHELYDEQLNTLKKEIKLGVNSTDIKIDNVVNFDEGFASINHKGFNRLEFLDRLFNSSGYKDNEG